MSLLRWTPYSRYLQSIEKQNKPFKYRWSGQQATPEDEAYSKVSGELEDDSTAVTSPAETQPEIEPDLVQFICIGQNYPASNSKHFESDYREVPAPTIQLSETHLTARIYCCKALVSMMVKHPATLNLQQGRSI